jgi:hypothetical protein
MKCRAGGVIMWWKVVYLRLWVHSSVLQKPTNRNPQTIIKETSKKGIRNEHMFIKLMKFTEYKSVNK